jgi:hypothetical protein
MEELTFDEHYERVSQNIYSLVMLKFDIQYFYRAPEEIQERVFLKFPLIVRIRNMTYRTLVLAVYNTLKRNERYSLVSILKRFKADSSDHDLGTRQKINQLMKHLQFLADSENFKDLEAKRNQHFAHLAHPQSFRDTKITYGQVVKLVSEIEEVFRGIHLLVRNTDIRFDMLEDDTGHHLYRALLSYQNLQELIFTELKKPNLDLNKIEELRQL